ncbi:clumping factor A-like isoform X2 [Labrus bergylta]|uniref:clumping factor A-like isoform X2 n=1 Tax=Labrus bergylta TaxID=56723 RepID=UPI0033141F26
MKKVPDFSDSLYDSSDDSTEGPSTQSKSETASQRLDTLQDFPQTLSDSTESNVEEFNDEDSTKDHSDVQSDIEVVPKLRRTESIQIQKILVGSDASSVDSEEEYIPGPMEESTDSDCSLEIPMTIKNMNEVSTSLTRCKSSSQSQSESSSQIQFVSPSQSQFESSSQSSSFEKSNGPADEDALENHENNASIYVNPVLKKEDGSRLYNKKHHCFYCKKVVQKMLRHLLRMHNDEIDVTKAFSLPNNSKERRLHLDFIRNKGNFEHNTNAFESQKGKLIPFKQPKKKTEGQEFLHCVYCYGLFTKRVLWRHFQVCKFKPQEKKSKPGKTRVQALCAFAERAPPGFSDAYWKFLNDMNQDKIALAVSKTAAFWSTATDCSRRTKE